MAQIVTLQWMLFHLRGRPVLYFFVSALAESEQSCLTGFLVCIHSAIRQPLTPCISSLMNEVVVTHPTIGSNVEEVRQLSLNLPQTRSHPRRL